MTNTIIQSTTLYYAQGSSDKVYQAAIEELPGDEGGHVVTFAYGRRGSTMNAGTKTPEPVGFVEAQRIYSKLVASKTAKGYTPGEDGTPYRGTDSESLDTGIRPQLANPVDEEEVEALLKDEFVCMQEKLDGRRLMIRKEEGAVTGINRRGLAVAFPGPVAEDIEDLPGTFLLDGEAVGDTFHVFDILERDGVDLRGRGFIDRMTGLEELLHDQDCQAIEAVPPAFLEKDKRKLFKLLRKCKAEGVVFKLRYSQYRPGCPASGGDWLKFKFVESASFIVAGRNGTRRSVALELFDDQGSRVPAGNVTIPPNHPMPEPGEVVEVRYLHAFRESGSVYQPVYLGPRDDIPPEDCTTDQLKFKPEPATA